MTERTSSAPAIATSLTTAYATSAAAPASTSRRAHEVSSLAAMRFSAFDTDFSLHQPRALSETDCRCHNPRVTSQLYSWGARALFIGSAFGLSPHRNAVAVVAVGLEAPFELSWDAHAASQSRLYRRCRSALIPPNTLQHFR